MVMNPHEIERTEFRTNFRGYDKPEVREFLRRIARDLAAQRSASQNEPSDQATPSEHTAPAVVDAQPVREQAVAAVSTQPVEDHRFQALGDRIAGLLKSAHESAANLRDTAETEVLQKLELAKSQGDAIRSEAEAEAQEIVAVAHAEADAVLVRSEADAERLKTGAEELHFNAELAVEAANQVKDRAAEDADVEIQTKHQEVEALSSAAQADRDRALAELSDARGQVAELLGQARSQSEFIRHEADEVIRARVRRNTEQAEERLNVLRNSEIASRERIIAAHRELEGAMARLELDPAPALPSDPAQYALDGAQDRADATNYGETTADFSELDAAADAAELSGRLADEGVEPALPKLGDTISTDVSSTEVEQGAAEIAGAADVLDSGTAQAEPEIIEVEVLEPRATEVLTREPAEEDALGRLVRQAMEQAVDSARSTDS